MRRHDKDFVFKFLQSHNLKLKNLDYKNVDQKLEIECEKGHTFFRCFDKIKSGRIKCPVCSKLTTIENEKAYNKKVYAKKLSAQQLTVAESIMAGKSNDEIAKQLKITTSAVKNTATAVYKKFGVGSRVQFLALRG